eukprot:Gregarina_sp_Poly_1__8040@NODE_461_length_8201_cov_115_438530_g375_i0_p11_GENE_NODE_461_length_8201_cov_115_438530_g375_i0NODE_461_length_8201_cov_115_438530_g375_i0_p11_ORF_typecomplete_len103_score3_87_NODE_461_length_8201_cov_115_438530_g375_i067987106
MNKTDTRNRRHSSHLHCLYKCTVCFVALVQKPRLARQAPAPLTRRDCWYPQVFDQKTEIAGWPSSYRLERQHPIDVVTGGSVSVYLTCMSYALELPLVGDAV